MEGERTYIAIDLKSFYASVECMERGLDPLTTNLVVADVSRTDKTICLAVSPSLKAFHIPGRARLFEVRQRVKEVNCARLERAPGHRFSGSSYLAPELEADPSLKLDFIAAVPQMKKYMEYSVRIYNIYLKYIAAEDIHVYSVDECFMDVTNYLSLYRMTAHQLAVKMIREVLAETGITATGGIGSNLYLCKIAMDIMAKHVPADADGVRIAELNEESYRRQLWDHTPITDFWRVGRGYAARLARMGLLTMGDVAACSVHDEELLYKAFGVNAELLIDHAWGWEPVTIADIKAYRPEKNSIGSGQVLTHPYPCDKGRLLVREMADDLVLTLVEKGLATDQIILDIGYDIENLKDPARAASYTGPIVTDRYGRSVPKPAHGSIRLGEHSSSTRLILDKSLELYDRIADPTLLIRRLNICAADVLREEECTGGTQYEQLDLFTDYAAEEEQRMHERDRKQKEKQLQHAALSIKKRFGKNALLKGSDLEEGATAIERNNQVGGHKA